MNISVNDVYRKNSQGCRQEFGLGCGIGKRKAIASRGPGGSVLQNQVVEVCISGMLRVILSPIPGVGSHLWSGGGAGSEAPHRVNH